MTWVCLEVASVATDVTQAFLLLEHFLRVSVRAAGPLSATIWWVRYWQAVYLCTEQDNTERLID